MTLGKRMRPRRTVNPWMKTRPVSKHKVGHEKVVGACAYCGVRRAVTRDHVIPRSVLRSYNRAAPEGAPSVPGKWLDVVGACFECNVTKSSSRLVPPSWKAEVNQLNRFFGGTEWRVWSGSPSDPALKAVHV